MVENSKIEWTTHTFNPWIGCSKVSAGCHHCYAETLMDTRYGRVQWGENGTRVRTSEANWKKPLKWDRDTKARQQYHSAYLADDAPRPRVFCASLADVFEDRDELITWREDLFELIDKTPDLDWLLLTKRPDKIRELLDHECMSSFYWPGASGRTIWNDLEDGHFPHVWIGTSVENQETADERIPHLLKIPASVRFLSMEPLLGPVDLYELTIDHEGYGPTVICPLTGEWAPEHDPPYAGLIDWVIVGGESGPKARPMHPDWVREICGQCMAAGVPFFFKQWGEWIASEDYCSPAKLEGNLIPTMILDKKLMSRVGKKAAGRMLDGREWSQFPAQPIPF